MFHKEGFAIIIATVLGGSILTLLSLLFLANLPWLQLPIIVLVLIVEVLVLQFFRNPDRSLNRLQPNMVLAPADGKVVVVEETTEDECLKDRRIQISIFMSPLNVHVNRNPVSGSIEFYQYHAGKYLMAWNPKSSTENERTTILYNTGKEKVLIRQIAGFVARRIICYARKGQEVRQGDDIGFIRFGSRVDVFLPLNAKLLVKPGEKVVGNRTVLAEL